MPLFDAYSRLSLDTCAVLTRDELNLQYALHCLQETRGPGGASAASVVDVQTQQTHLLMTSGYGIDPSKVDFESGLRDKLTHGRTRQALANRVFTAAPDFGRGGLRADIESRLLSGHDTTAVRECGPRVTEIDWNRFDPGVCPTAVDNIVAPWPIGEPSREIARSPAFLKDIGYIRCGGDTMPSR